MRILPLALLVLVVVLGSGAANRQAAGAANSASGLEAALGALEAAMSVSHIRVEELVAGDRTVIVRTDIAANQDEAVRLCRTLRSGGSFRFGRVSPINDPGVAALVRRLCQEVEAFRARTRRRLAAPLQERRAGSPAEGRYDAAFASVLEVGSRLRDEFADFGRRQRTRTLIVQGAVVLLLAMAVVAAAFLIRRRDQQLAVAADEREAVLQSAGEGILAFDRDGVVQFVNTAAASLLGSAGSQLVGRPIGQLVADHDPSAGSLPEWLRVEEGSRGEDRRFVRPGGSTFPIAYRLSPPQPTDAASWWVLTFANIEDRLELEARRDAELAELRALREALVPPDVPPRPGLVFATCHQSAKDGVAGDFFLVTKGCDDSTVMVVGDVLGKGVSAARRAAFLRTALATFAPYTDSPRKLLELGNRSLRDASEDPDRFVTAVCAVIQPSRGAVRWACAGHPPPITLDTGTRLQGRPGLMLGVADEPRLEEHVVHVAPGGGLLLYSDGLTEARRLDVDRPQLLGFDRIFTTVRKHAGEEPAAVTAALRNLASAHSAGSFADDLCMVAVRIASPTATDASPTTDQPSLAA